jgi:hypothetical protein
MVRLGRGVVISVVVLEVGQLTKCFRLIVISFIITTLVILFMILIIVIVLIRIVAGLPMDNHFLLLLCIATSTILVTIAI